MPEDPAAQSSTQGLFSYPGAVNIRSCSYTRSHGISPGTASISLVAQETSIDKTGDLVFTYGDRIITIPDCRAKLGSIRRSVNNDLWEITLEDRRWKWQYSPPISGTFNERRGDGSANLATAESAALLMTRLLLQMGELGFDVSDVPFQQDGVPIFPPVVWDFADPATELAALADLVGCRVVYRLDDTVAINLTGEGEFLPDIETNNDPEIQEDSLTITLPEIPDELLVVGGRDQYQVEITLEAVGEDLDGQTKTLPNLSYDPNDPFEPPAAPSKPWNPTPFDNVGDRFGDKAQDLAIKTVFRQYQIPDTFDVPGWKTGVTRDEALPLLDVLVETSTVGTKIERKPAEISGVFFVSGLATNSAVGTLLATADSDSRVTFSVDSDTGIITFSKPIYRIDANNEADAADLVLKATVSGERYERTKELKTGGGDLVKQLRHEEIVELFNTTSQNEADVNAEADYYLNADARNFNQTEARQVKYAALRDDIEMDGRIQQLSFSVGLSPAVTTASSNDEHDESIPSYSERRILEGQRATP